MIKPLPFIHAGIKYEVRCATDGHTFRVQAYKDDKPANGYVYEVTIPVAFDLKMIRGEDAVQDLIETAKRDVVEGNWERWLKAVAAAVADEKNAPTV